MTPLLYRRALYIKGFLRYKKWIEFVSEGAVFFEMSRAYIGSRVVIAEIPCAPVVLRYLVEFAIIPTK